MTMTTETMKKMRTRSRVNLGNTSTGTKQRLRNLQCLGKIADQEAAEHIG
jgi:hypothetical protein